MNRLAIFDCDGTLVDSQANICRAMEECFVRAGLKASAGSDNNIKILTYDYNGHNGIALWQFSVFQPARSCSRCNKACSMSSSEMKFGTGFPQVLCRSYHFSSGPHAA